MSVYPSPDVTRSAMVSPDGTYRYSLTRAWRDDTLEYDEAPRLLPFLMLNPSTADADRDDPTIRRCVGLSRSLGYSGILVWNLYAFRTKSPAAMFLMAASGVDVVGPENDSRLQAGLLMCRDIERPVVAAWGVNARPERVQEVLSWPGSEQLHAFATTNSGAPRHPLYLPADSELTRWPR